MVSNKLLAKHKIVY